MQDDKQKKGRYWTRKKHLAAGAIGAAALFLLTRKKKKNVVGPLPSQGKSGNVKRYFS